MVFEIIYLHSFLNSHLKIDEKNTEKFTEKNAEKIFCIFFYECFRIFFCIFFQNSNKKLTQTIFLNVLAKYGSNIETDSCSRLQEPHFWI